MLPRRLLLALALPFLLGSAALRADEPVVAGPKPEEGYVPGQFARPSDRPGGKACWAYLRSPLRPPTDRICGRCANRQDCSALDRPKGASAACWGNTDEECFWKRHCYAWGLQCSECQADDTCPDCDEAIGGRDPKVLERLQAQVALEQTGNQRPMWVVVSPHFYVVTDIHRKLKVPTDGGAPRVASGHEVAHLFAQRAEMAYDDFCHYFTPPPGLGKPMAVLLFDRLADKEAAAARYLGSPRTDMLYGGGSNRISGGIAGNGFVVSLAEERSDLNMHANCRHMIGHILFSCWLQVSGEEKNCPIWTFTGVAHFLEKLLPEHLHEYATFCSNETTAPSGSPKDWDKKAAGLARRKLPPIETFFGRESMGDFSYDEHVQAWSIMDLMLKEDRARWLRVLGELRYGAAEGAAFKVGLGITPDEFSQRWVDRLTGKRPTMGEIRADSKPSEEEPGRRERERIEQALDERELAGLILGLDVIQDLRMAKVVASRFVHPTDLVRETVNVILQRTKEPKILEWMATEALDDTEPLVRAGVARVLGEIKHAPARERLERLLEDRHWLVRAEAAWALGQIHDLASLPFLVRGLEDQNPKTWMVIADAVASYGRPDKRATESLIPRLQDRQWQVRVTACQALARVGTEEAIGPLIDRFNREEGRLYRELRAALKAITQDDLGPNPETWRTWWEKQVKEKGGLGPMPEVRPHNPADDRYGRMDPPTKDDPTYYGRRIFSQSVGFVLDTSMSMDHTIRLSPEAAKTLGDIPTEGTRLSMARKALCDALRKLDPRARFQLTFFSTEVRPWKKRLLPATPGNVDAACGAVMNAPPQGETNIHGALKAALGLYEKGVMEADLDPVPDTVFFLSDGSPTHGEIVDADALVSWFENLNRFAKIDITVIAMGNLGVDIPFLQRLAKAGGGQFIHIPEL